MATTKRALSTQPQHFVDMVTNIRPGQLYIYSYPDQIIFTYDNTGRPQAALFYVEEVQPITTRFGSRDRIVRGWRCHQDPNGSDGIILIERRGVWCSQLADTEPFTEDFHIMNTNLSSRLKLDLL